MIRKVFILFLLVISAITLFSQSESCSKILVFEVREEVTSSLWHKMQKTFETTQVEKGALAEK